MDHPRQRAAIFLVIVITVMAFASSRDKAVPEHRGLAAAYRCHGAAAALFGLMGMVYLRRREFMPYHAVAIGQKWHELEKPAQTMFLSSMRIIGSAWFALAVALGLLLRHGFSAGMTWAVYGIPAVGLLVSVPTLLAVLNVRRNTAASPPWPPLAIAVVLFITGLVLSIVSRAGGA